MTGTFWRKRSVLVTGGTGFLGTWLVQELLGRGANVVALVRDRVPSSPFFLLGLDSQVVDVPGDVKDSETVERSLHEYEIDTVFHLAAQAIVGVAGRSPVETFETNIRGTWNVLDACRRHGRISRIVVASSDKAYGAQKVLPYTEECPLQGRHPYDVSKSCADLICASYNFTYGLPVSVTRCGNLFGPGDVNFSRIVPGTIRSALLGERPIIRSDGTPVRDYVHVLDIVGGYLKLAEAMDRPEVKGRAFNFGTGEQMTVLELTRAILAAAGRGDLEPVILNQAACEIPAQYLASDLARSVLGWRPERTVAERLEETVEWYRNYFERAGESRKGASSGSAAVQAAGKGQ